MVFSITTLSNLRLFVNCLTKFHWRCCYVLVDKKQVSLYYFNRRVIQNITTYLYQQHNQDKKGKCI